MIWARERRNSFVCLEGINISWTVADFHMIHGWFGWITMNENDSLLFLSFTLIMLYIWWNLYFSMADGAGPWSRDRNDPESGISAENTRVHRTSSRQTTWTNGMLHQHDTSFSAISQFWSEVSVGTGLFFLQHTEQCNLEIMSRQDKIQT